MLIGVFTKRLVFSQTSKKIPALENLEDRSRRPRNRENHKPRDPWSRTSPHGRAVYEFVKIAKHQLTPINTNQAPIKHQSKHKNTTLTPRFCLKAPRFCRNFKMMREKTISESFAEGGRLPSESFAEGGVGPSESFAEVGSDRPSFGAGYSLKVRSPATRVTCASDYPRVSPRGGRRTVREFQAEDLRRTVREYRRGGVRPSETFGAGYCLGRHLTFCHRCA